MPKDDMRDLFDDAKEHIKKTRDTKLPIEVPVLPPSVPRPAPRVPRPAEPTIVEAAPDSVPASFDPREADTKQLPRPRMRREEDLPLAELAGVTPSIMAQAARVPLARMLILIAASGAAVTGVVAAIGAAVVNVVTALRPPSHIEIQKELDAIKVRVNGDFGLPLEVETRQKKDQELDDKIEALGKKHEKLANSVSPKVKVKLNPKPATEEP